MGKDTLANHVIANHGGGHVVSFAAPVYEVASAIQRVLGRHVEKDAGLLQLVGLGLRDHYGDNIWVDRAMAKINAINQLDSTANVIVPDMRFPNEMKELKDAGFVTIKVVRPDRLIDRDPNHPSETALADAPFDYVILNDGSEAEYLAKIDKLIASLPL